MPFSRLSLPPSLCLLFPLPTPLSSRCYLSSLNKLSNNISVAVCISLCCDFGFSFGWTIHFFFQRHDAKNGKTDKGWKRMKSYLSRWFQCDYYSSCKLHVIYHAKTKRFLKTRIPNLSIVHTTQTTVTSPWFGSICHILSKEPRCGATIAGFHTSGAWVQVGVLWD